MSRRNLDDWDEQKVVEPMVSKDEDFNNFSRAFVAELMDETRKDIASQITGGSRQTFITYEIYYKKLLAELKAAIEEIK